MERKGRESIGCISPDVAHVMLYDDEHFGNNKKLLEVTIKVAYVLCSCLLYSETYNVFNSSSIQYRCQATTCELKLLYMLPT